MKSQLTARFNATPLYQDKTYSIEKYINTNTNKYSLVVIRDKTFTDWVMVYDNPFLLVDENNLASKPIEIAFDNPYRIAKRIRNKVHKIAQTLN